MALLYKLPAHLATRLALQPVDYSCIFIPMRPTHRIRAHSRPRSRPSLGTGLAAVSATLLAVAIVALSGAQAHPPPTSGLLPTPSGDSTIVVDTFTYPDRIGRFPTTWEGRSGWRQTVAAPQEIYYYIEQQEDEFFLRAETQGTAVNFGRSVDVNLRIYNRFRWRWRVHQLPREGDETVEQLNDSAAAIRIVFHGGFIPKTLKYVWSSTLPVGTEAESPTNSRTKVIVVRSGPNHLGEWMWEDVNAYDDYKRLFGGEPRKVQAVAVITDSDNTGSPVRGDYDDITFWISPPDTSETDAGNDPLEKRHEP